MFNKKLLSHIVSFPNKSYFIADGYLMKIPLKQTRYATNPFTILRDQNVQTAIRSDLRGRARVATLGDSCNF